MLKNWPWPRSISPFYEQVKKESSEWCESFQAFSPKAQNAFNICDFSLLASLGYPRLNKDVCRIGCDLMHLFFLIDEHSDLADGRTARHQMDCVMDALRNPHKVRPANEWIGGAVTQSFWLNAIRTATPTAQRRFIETFGVFTDSIVQQAVDRDENRIRGITGYLDLRRDTVQLDIPDEVMENAVIKELTALCIDIAIAGNDLLSYNVEQARGDADHNLVTIVMHELDLDLDRAVQWIADWNDSLVARFMEIWPRNWARACDQWSFESGRYFGKDGLDIQRNRKVILLPNRQPDVEEELYSTWISLHNSMVETRLMFVLGVSIGIME
ncbi:terpenoid synthase [Mycena olivaceomarginata]|nr:terpenoid synthase [Mycena olivaceomarginata]